MENKAKNFALQLGSLIALYVSLSALLSLIFGVINLSFPDALTSVWQYTSAQDSIRFSIAVLVVSFPTYIILTRLVNKGRRADNSTYAGFTKWLIYLSLLVGAGALLIDLVAVIYTFLNGEITQRFVFKALAVLVVVGSALDYYVLDAKGYWNKNEKKSIYFGIGISVFVAVSVVYGFMQIDTPQEVRQQQLDQEQISDLQNMQYHIEEYFRLNEALPVTLADVYTDVPVPEAPENRPAYKYNNTGEGIYELCAMFTHQSLDENISYRAVEPSISKQAYTWDHGAGEKCFERIVEKQQLKFES